MTKTAIRATALCVWLAATSSPVYAQTPVQQPALTTRAIPLITQDGLKFRDLNRNGALDRYEDWRLSPEARAADLLPRMTLDEKLGQMIHGSLWQASATSYNVEGTRQMVLGKHITALITRLGADPKSFAEANNSVQAIAEEGRLGIPVSISSDPRHQLSGTMGASVAAGGFTAFPDTTGLAAINDYELTRRSADIVRQEYMAVGIRVALHPQPDLATEPRWTRINGTFGEDPDISARMTAASVVGLQDGDKGIGKTSVAAVVKHWVGNGAAANQGFDSHNTYGRYSSVTPETLPLHIKPFEAAFKVGAASVMPQYAVPYKLKDEKGQPHPLVGGGYSEYLNIHILRGQYKFTGVVLSDWAITTDCNELCRNGTPPGVEPSWANATPSWGVEHLSTPERFALGVKAGIDQFGGTEDVASLKAAVEQGLLTQAEVDTAVTRVLVQTFTLGLFEAPFVDADRAGQFVGNAAFKAEGHAAQARSMVVLENKAATLPLAPGKKVYGYNMDADALKAHGFTVVDTPEQADVAIVRLSTPHRKLHPGFAAGNAQHEGPLNFWDGDTDYEDLKRISAAVPTIVVVHMDRPAILTNIKSKATALLASFGATDDAVLDGLTGKIKPEGRLPFELPSTMQAVEAQSPDAPYDSKDPLYKFGYRAE